MVKLTLIVFCAVAFFAWCESAGCKKNILERKLSSAERSLIVRTHNKLRKALEKGQVKGQPKAIKMNRLKWDARLAKQAQKIADKCKFRHATVKDERWSVGQNLFEEASTAPQKGLNFTDAVHSWFNEHKLYRYPFYKRETGHYTQVVWADTKYVGCGYTHFKTKDRFKYHKLLVCNYGPAGNVQGRAPYKLRSKE